MRPNQIIGVFCLTAATQAGDFINLGFDDPDLSHAVVWRPFWSVGGQDLTWAPVGEAFRGWQVSYDLSDYGGRVSVDVGPLSLGRTDTGFWVQTSANHIPPILFTPAVPRPEFSMSQTGKVPLGVRYLEFLSYAILKGGETVPAQRALIYLDGVLQSPFEIGPSTYVVDVAQFAGQETELKVVFPAARVYLFDIKGFTAVPEPSTFALMAMGSCAVGWLVRRGRHCG